MRKIAKQKFIATNYGWVSPLTPPVNHNQVVVLVFSTNNDLFLERLGYYENGEWEIYDDEFKDFIIYGWFPYPFSPDNN
jgi:hypothetical protein